MSKAETLPWDASDHLNSPAAVMAYLDAAFEDGDPSVVAAAQADVARSRCIIGEGEQSGNEADRQHWMEENRSAFDAYDAYVEKHGVYGSGKRLF